MKLIDQVKNIQEESFETWFSRWYEKQNLEKDIVRSAQKGYNGFRITITGFYEYKNDFSKERKYKNRRLRDKRTVEKIREKLGEGFDVNYKEDVQKSKILSLEVTRTSDWIEIRWEA